MPIENKKEVTTKSYDPDVEQVSHTATTAQTPTESESKDAKADRNNAWIWYIVGIIDLVLALRLLFHLFGARSSGFTDFLYSITGPFVAPFRGIFASPNVGGSYFDTAALIAIVIYILLGWVISGLINLITRPSDSNRV
jgi:uncharacterized protein YggT (Ycf19 family)